MHRSAEEPSVIEYTGQCIQAAKFLTSAGILSCFHGPVKPVPQSSQLSLQDFLVKKQKGVEGLVLSRGTNPGITRQAGEKPCDLFLTHFHRMALVAANEDCTTAGLCRQRFLGWEGRISIRLVIVRGLDFRR